MFYFLLAMVNIIDIVNMSNKKIKGGNMITVEHVKSKISLSQFENCCSMNSFIQSDQALYNLLNEK